MSRAYNTSLQCFSHPTGLVFVLCVLCARPQHAHAQAKHASKGDESSSAEYQRTVHQALEEYQTGNYGEMYAAMRRAHELEPNARTLRGMGIAAFELKNYTLALVNLRAALVDTRKPLTAQMLAEVRDVIRRAELYVDTITLAVTPSNAEITVDGDVPTLDEHGALLVTLGKRELRASLAGYTTAQRTLTVVGGEARQVSITLAAASAADHAAAPTAATTPILPVASVHADGAATSSDPQDAHGSQRTWAYVAFAGAGAFAIGSAVALVVRENAAVHYNSMACAGNRRQKCPDDYDRAHLTQTLGIVGAVTAGALALTGVILLVTEPNADERTASAEASGCAFGPLGVSCAGRF